MLQLPSLILPVLWPFADLFTRPTWAHLQTLFIGTLLSQGPRTITAALRAAGLHQVDRFEKYHRVLNRARWSGLQGARILLGLLISMLPPDFPLIVVIDDTIERRKGQRITAKGIYRDPVRSSQRHVVTCFGLQWICMALVVPLPWSQRPWSLPFLTLLAPSEEANKAAGKRHRTLVDWASVMVRLTSRWLKHRPWVLLGDGAFACVRFGWQCHQHQVALVSRLRLDARLFDFPSPPKPGRRGPKPKKGDPCKKLQARIAEVQQKGELMTVSWHRRDVTLRVLSETCLWHTPGVAPLPIRWVLLVDPNSQRAHAFFTTQLSMSPSQVIKYFGLRWSIEVTFEEARRHLGVETQRQWSDLAIARTTPMLFALFSLVCCIAYQGREHWCSLTRSAAWYQKPQTTFSDLLAFVRRILWTENNFVNFTPDNDQVVISRDVWERMLEHLISTA